MITRWAVSYQGDTNVQRVICELASGNHVDLLWDGTYLSLEGRLVLVRYLDMRKDVIFFP